MNRVGVGLAALLIVAAIVAFLTFNQMRTVNRPDDGEPSAVQQAQQAVEALNDAQRDLLNVEVNP